MKEAEPLSTLLADIVLDPARLADLMRRTGPYSGHGLADILRLQGAPVSAGQHQLAEGSTVRLKA